MSLNWSHRIISEPEHHQNFFHGNEQAISSWVLRRLEETGLAKTLGDEISPQEFVGWFKRRPYKLGDQVGALPELAVATDLAGDITWSAECVGYCFIGGP